MSSIFALLVLFIVLGVFARSFNNRVRMLLIVGIVGFLLYLYLT